MTSKEARLINTDNIRVANGSIAVMIEKMKRLSADKFVKKGDILGVSRKGLYNHYAVYIGEGRVIHYCGETKDFFGKVTIHEAPISEFIKDSKTFFVVWFNGGIPVRIQRSTSFLFASGTEFCDSLFLRKKRKVYSGIETVNRAKSRLGEEKYNLVTNSCEHFAMWCKTGTAESSQAKLMVNYAIAAGMRFYGSTKVDASELIN